MELMTGNDLTAWRHARRQVDPRWTQQYAADWYGVSVRTWQRYESRGDRPIPRRVAARVRASRIARPQTRQETPSHDETRNAAA